MFRLLLMALCLTSAFSASAQTHSSKLKPLYFQASKNKLQVLPQRFEYTLIDDDRLKIGDILIDTTQVSFQVAPSENITGTYRISFSWPAGLIQEGQLTIKNNSGKGIFNKILKKENLKFSRGTPEEGTEGLRSEVATLTVDGVEANLIDDMKYYPFMAFCIYRESEETKLYLCSKELYLSTANDGKMLVKSRSSGKKNAQIEINGKLVGNQGIIYLNDRTENVAFKMQTQSGAFLEIETRMKDVDFKDVVITDDENNMIITASGAEPVDESKVKKISENEWQITLPKGRPVLYLKGDGDIPMRQEFYVRGTLPRAKNRPFVSLKSPSKTYSSKVTLNGIAPEGVSLRPLDTDEDAFEMTKKNQFKWTLRNIPSGKTTRRYLSVTAEGQDLIAGYDIYRGQPFSLDLSAKYLSPSAIAYGDVSFQWWFENFLLLNTDFTRFHWGISLEAEQQLMEKSGLLKANFYTAELLWRYKEGFNLVEDTWGLSLPMQMIQVPNGSTTTYGFGAFLNKTPKNFLKNLMHLYELKLQYFAGSMGDFKISSALRLKANAYLSLNPQWHFHYGLVYMDYKFNPSPSNQEAQIGLETGLLYKF
ncbi:MAG: hypothetical protein ACXVCP_05720 [Bdellovibrio sp.]